ncbi:hypothetical protein HZS_4253, partial [Henneguya salminicola]
MKCYVRFLNIPFSIKIKNNNMSFKEFVETISSHLKLPSDHVKIKFENDVEVDKNYNWPIFKPEFLEKENINVIYNKLEDINEDDRTILGFVKKYTDTELRRVFGHSTLGLIRSTSDDSKIAEGKLNLLFKTDKSPYSSKFVNIRLIAQIVNHNIYYVVNTADDFKGASFKHMESFGTIIPIEDVCCLGMF